MTQEEKLVQAMNIALSRTNGQYQKWYQEHGLNSYLIQTLYALYMEPSMSQKEISENYQMPKQTVNNTVKSLERRGYVELIPDENDKRGRRISFTAEGREYAILVLDPVLKLDQAVVERMGVENYGSLIQLLNAYSDALTYEIRKEQ